MDFSILESFLIVLLIALVVTVIFRYARLPVILGYLLVGTLVGPHVLGWLPDTKDIKELAEFGVVLLMFTVGLEFSLSKLLMLRYSVFVLGGLQVLFSILITVFIGRFYGLSTVSGIVIGSIVAMSSTAIVVKQLYNQFEANTKYGLNAIGILLFQDLAVILILVFIASSSGTAQYPFWTMILWSGLKGIMAIALMFAVGRWLLRPMFRLIASVRVIELFTLAVLFVAVGAAWLTNFLGLSYALGAFIAGIMLAESEYRHQIKVEIRPFRDVLLGLFFISIGMLVNITTWPETWYWILLTLAALMLGKSTLIILFCRLSKYDFSTATRTGVILAQGGEFGVAILSLALIHNLIPSDWGQSVLAALLISFALAPIMIRYNEKIAKFFFPKTTESSQSQIEEDVGQLSKGLTNHIIICGFGRVGQNIVNFLEKVNHPYIGLDLDPKLIQEARLAGSRVSYGNATHPEILKSANLKSAKAVVITFADITETINTLDYIRSKKSKVPVFVRCRDQSEFDNLKAHGATKIVSEIFEESLTMVSQLLRLLRIPKAKIVKLLQDVRDKDYDLLHHVFPGSFTEDIIKEDIYYEHLRSIPLPEEAYAIGHKLSELKLKEVDVITVHRGPRQMNPRRNIKFKSGDILVLYGSFSDLKDAEKRLLDG